jgi:hypothetical protein
MGSAFALVLILGVVNFFADRPTKMGLPSRMRLIKAIPQSATAKENEVDLGQSNS